MYTPEKRKLGHGADRAGRKFQILSWLQDQTLTQFPDRYYTSHQIAKAIGLKPSQHVRNMLYELFREGAIEGFYEDRPCGITRTNYRFKNQAFELEQYREFWEQFAPQVQLTLEGAL